MQNTMLVDMPQEIETERLLILSPRPGDDSIVYKTVVESLPELRECRSSAQRAIPEPTAEETEILCRQWQAEFILRTSFAKLIFEKETSTHVGSCRLKQFDWTVPKCEISYFARTSFARRGYITEAVIAVTDFAFNSLGVRRVEARVDEQNLRSCGVCIRAGYQLEGTRRNDDLGINGEVRNTRVYAKVR